MNRSTAAIPSSPAKHLQERHHRLAGVRAEPVIFLALRRPVRPVPVLHRAPELLARPRIAFLRRPPHQLQHEPLFRRYVLGFLGGQLTNETPGAARRIPGQHARPVYFRGLEESCYRFELTGETRTSALLSAVMDRFEKSLENSTVVSLFPPPPPPLFPVIFW